VGSVHALLPGEFEGFLGPPTTADHGQFQGLMFYIPHWIWKNWEEGKMRMISEGLRGVLTMPIAERRHRQERLVRYLVDSMSTHNTYAFGYFFCEFLNVLNVVSCRFSAARNAGL
jgi:hypothetical protein